MDTYEIIKNKKDMLIFEASKWLGLLEDKPNYSKQIEIFQSVIGSAQRESWCLAFIQFCVKSVDDQFNLCFDIDHPKHCLYRTEWTRDLWDATDDRARVEMPDRGDVIVWACYEDDLITERGHVGIILEVFENGTALVIEGNTKPAPRSDQTHDGVFIRLRRLDAKTGDFRVLGFLTPWL